MKKLEGLIIGRLKQGEKTSTVNVGEGVISYSSYDSLPPFFHLFFIMKLWIIKPTLAWIFATGPLYARNTVKKKRKIAISCFKFA
jgi:hypothetical protein